MRFLTRLLHVPSFLLGEFIVLMPEGDTLVVDCGAHKDKSFIKEAAALFFKTAYTSR